MLFWLPIVAANAWALSLLLRGLRARDNEPLQRLFKRAQLCAWLSCGAAALIVGSAIWCIFGAYQVPGGESVAPDQRQRILGLVVSDAMHAIFAALLLMLLPLVARAVVKGRAKRQRG